VHAGVVSDWEDDDVRGHWSGRRRRQELVELRPSPANEGASDGGDEVYVRNADE
jgi:DNA phosphorothioation-dependent restriction protein DptG